MGEEKQVASNTAGGCWTEDIGEGRQTNDSSSAKFYNGNGTKMKKEKGNIIIVVLVVVAVAFVGGYWYWQNNNSATLTTTPNSPKEKENIVTPTLTPSSGLITINNYELYPADKIPIDSSIPVYPGATVSKKYKGKNEHGQDIVRVEYDVPPTPLIEPNDIAVYFEEELPKNRWTIASVDQELCLNEAIPSYEICSKWNVITAEKNGIFLTFETVSRTDYRIDLLYGERIDVSLELPSVFPSELLPSDFKQAIVLSGINTQGEGEYILESYTELSISSLEHNKMINAAGWTENCGLGSSHGGSAVSYGCSKGNSSIFVEREKDNVFRRDKTLIRYKFSLHD